MGLMLFLLLRTVLFATRQGVIIRKLGYILFYTYLSVYNQAQNDTCLGIMTLNKIFKEKK
jgi:hypothetical protein